MELLSLICSNCFNENEVDYDIGDAIPICNACQHELLPVHPLEGDEALLNKLQQQTQPLLINFWGAWSGPCRDFSPIFNELAERYKGRVIFVRMNSEELQVLANKLNIHSFPTLILFKGQIEQQRLTGFINERQLSTLLDKYS